MNKFQSSERVIFETLKELLTPSKSTAGFPFYVTKLPPLTIFG